MELESLEQGYRVECVVPKDVEIDMETILKQFKHPLIEMEYIVKSFGPKDDKYIIRFKGYSKEFLENYGNHIADCVKKLVEGNKKEDFSVIELDQGDFAFVTRSDGSFEFYVPKITPENVDEVGENEQLLAAIASLLSKNDQEFLDLIQEKWEEIVEQGFD